MFIIGIIKVLKMAITNSHKFDNVGFELFLREKMVLCMVKK